MRTSLAITGIHDFVAGSVMWSGTFVDTLAPPERYSAAPSQLLALFHQEGDDLYAELVRCGWKSYRAKDREAPMMPE
ncbi:hypothetical protein AXG94_00980 [Pseudomonas corrugata]|nr:hypothetical protein AXG94_00980 [Pseudomonas corrugata]